MVWLGVKPKNSGKLWSGDHMITQNDDEMNVHNWIGVGGVGGCTKLYSLCSLKYCLGHEKK